MDETRVKALEIALQCASDKTGLSKIGPAELLEAARKIEAYLRHTEDDEPAKNPHPASVHELAN